MGFVKQLVGAKTGSGFQAQGANMAQANNAYNQAQNGLGQQQGFVNAVGAQNGLGNQSQVFAQQQALANQLQQQAQGQGPNPAQAALNQATGQNVANQAALMAGQRGAGANAGLIARQAAMQGANTQQQAVGQGATMQAQQQIAAQQALQNQQAQMANLANTQVGQQANALQNYNQLAQGEQGQLLGSIGNQNSANEAIAANNQKAQHGLLGGALGALGKGALALATGGASIPVSLGLDAAKSIATSGGGNASMPMPGVMNAATGGEIPGPRSKIAQHLCSGGMSYKSGGKVNGKAMLPGDSLKNDTVPAMLSPGEVVIPRHVMQSKDPAKGAAEFVAQIMARKKK